MESDGLHYLGSHQVDDQKFPTSKIEHHYMLKKSLIALSLAITCLPAMAQTGNSASEIDVNKIREIQSYFAEDAHRSHILVPSDKTLYAWQNMSRFYRTALIQREGAVSELEYDLIPEIGKIEYQRNDGSKETLEGHLAKYPTDGFLVVHKGKIAFEYYSDTMRPFDLHNWYSSGKILGSTMLAILETEGKVDVNKPVSYYLTELKDSVWDTVKVVEALDMTTGLDSTEHDEPTRDSRTNPDQGWYRWAASLDLFDDPRGLNETPIDVLRSMKRRQPAYSAYEYNSINTFVIDLIVERITNQTLPELLSETIWRPAGMESGAYIAVSDTGLPTSFGTMNSTLRDMARFGMAYTPSWKVLSDTPAIPQSVIELIQKGGDPEIYKHGYLGPRTTELGFSGEQGITNRYQWDAVFADGDFWKKGVGGQGLYISPDKDLVIVYFATGTGNDQEETITREIAKYFSSN